MLPPNDKIVKDITSESQVVERRNTLVLATTHWAEENLDYEKKTQSELTLYGILILYLKRKQGVGGRHTERVNERD